MKNEHLPKLYLIRRLIKNAHAREHKTLVAFDATKCFSNLVENFNFTFQCQNKFFFWLHFYSRTFLLQFLDGMVVCKTAQLHYG